MLICRNAEGVRGQRKYGNPWAKQTNHSMIICDGWLDV